jgi:hypothetical protein
MDYDEWLKLDKARLKREREAALEKKQEEDQAADDRQERQDREDAEDAADAAAAAEAAAAAAEEAEAQLGKEKDWKDESPTESPYDADGGLVERLDKELPRPPDPEVADDLTRFLSEGEFVIPVHVVEHFGEKFFADLISAIPPPEKNREIGLKKERD